MTMKKRKAAIRKALGPMKKHIDLVKELTDEAPVRVKISKTEQAYQDGLRQGKKENIMDTVKDYTRALQDAQTLFQEQKQAHIQAQTNLIHTFSSVIFMLGQDSVRGGKDTERA